MVAAGGVVVAGGGAAMGASVDMRYAAVYFASMGLVAYANILKERTFERGREAAGKALDVFVVNTFGSMAQVRSTADRTRVPWSAPVFGEVLRAAPLCMRRGLNE